MEQRSIGHAQRDVQDRAKGTKGFVVSASKINDVTPQTRIYAYDHQGARHHIDNGSQFLNKLQDKHFILKQFYGEHDQRNFSHELQAFSNVLSKLTKSDVRKYTAIRPIIYESKPIHGFSLENNGYTRYFVINQKGNFTLEEMMHNKMLNEDTFRKCITEILEAIIILSKHALIHGDVKPANIMLFNDMNGNSRFKLIDWEYMRSHDEIGTKYGAHPIYYENNKLFLSGIMQHYVSTVMCPSNDDEFEKFYEFIRMSWESYMNLRDIHENKQAFRTSFMQGLDTYNVGLIAQSLCHKLRLPNEYDTIATRICMFQPGSISCPLMTYRTFIETSNVASGDAPMGKHGDIYPLKKLKFKSLYVDLMKVVCSGSYKIDIFTNRGKKVVENKHIMSLIEHDTSHIAKEFIGGFMGFGKHAYMFQKELQNTITIEKIFNEHLEMTTIPQFSYKTLRVYGIACNNKYALLSLKGNHAIVNALFTKKECIHMYNNIYDILHMLHSHQHIHCDVKPENIVVFDQEYKYRLIDWQKVQHVKQYTNEQRYHCSKRTGSPVSFFMEFGSIDFAVTAVANANMHEYQVLAKNSTFVKKYQTVMDIFRHEFKTHTKEYMYTKWKYNMDLFNFGMTVLFILYKNNIQHKELEHIGYQLLTAQHITHVSKLKNGRNNGHIIT